MPAEVISLLSSPSTGSPQPSTSRTTTLDPAARLSTWDVYDVLDLTADTPTLTSSKRSRPAPGNDHLAPQPDDRWEGSHVDNGIFAESRGNKRRKVSSPCGFEENGIKSSSPRDLRRPRLPSHDSPPRIVRAQAEPIELTSSPTPEGREETRQRTSRDDWDPFATSSPRHRHGSKQPSPRPSCSDRQAPRSKTTIESDPFANSSPPRHHHASPEASARARRVDHHSLFVTSPSQPRPQQSKAAAARKNWDPISSSNPRGDQESGPCSSPPPLKRPRSHDVIDIQASSSEDDQAAASSDDFPDLAAFDPKKVKNRAKVPGPPSRKSTKTKKPQNSTTAMPASKKTADERQREREEKAAAREADRERKRLEKEEAKENRAKEKEKATALVEVNKVRTDKKVATPEMIVDLPSTLSDALILQIETLLKDLSVQHEAWTSPVENVVTWRRKVTSRFNEELGMWEPAPLRIQAESFALVIVTAQELVDLMLCTSGSGLEGHISKLRRHFPTCRLIYLVEGLAPLLRKNRNIRNRQFVSAVRGQDGPPSVSPAAAAAANAALRRYAKDGAQAQAAQALVSEDAVEDALLQLQVLHDVLIHHTNAAVETAQWVAVFTQHISTVPYRRRRDEAQSAGFCMEAGQVRTGEDKRDTYVRMLQEIVRVTAPIAYGIAAEYGTVSELVAGLEARGPLALEECKKSTNKDGSFSDRTVGQAVSKRVHKVFTGTDPSSTDV